MFGLLTVTSQTSRFSEDYFQLAYSACDSHLSKVFCSCPITTVLQQLVCNLLYLKTIPQKEIMKLKFKAIVLNYYVRDS